MKLKLAIYWLVAAAVFFLGIWLCCAKGRVRYPTQGAGAADLLGLKEEPAFATLKSPPVPKPRAVAVLPKPTYTFYFAATAFDRNGLESDYSNEVTYSTTNPMKAVTLAWDASISTNGPLTYWIYQGGASRSYTNHYAAGTNLALAVRPALPRTNLVLTVTTSGATDLSWAPTLRGPWTSLNATNWSDTNPPAPRYFRAVANKAGSKLFISRKYQ